MHASDSTGSEVTTLRIVRLAAMAAGALLVVVAFAGGSTDALMALPAVFLMMALVAGRYPGLRTIVRIAARLRRRPVRASTKSSPARGFGSLEPRALRLLVGSRELRGPPSAPIAGL